MLTASRMALVSEAMPFDVVAVVAHPRADDRAVVIVLPPGEPVDRMRLRTAHFFGPRRAERVKTGTFQTGYFSLTACLSIIAVEFRR